MQVETLIFYGLRDQKKTLWTIIELDGALGRSGPFSQRFVSGDAL